MFFVLNFCFRCFIIIMKCDNFIYMRRNLCYNADKRSRRRFDFMKSFSLNGEWRLSGRDLCGTDEVTLVGRVPGCVQLDLSREGYLPEDLYMGLNILETEKYETYEWVYERTFTAPSERERVYLVFEGVDTLAEYFINGEKIGESDNMLISHEFEIGKYLRDGENTLTVRIDSTCLALTKYDTTALAMHSWTNGGAETHIRRAQHTYGWDIMPRAVTAGLWRDVKIEVRDEIRFTQLYLCGNPQRCEVFYEIDAPYKDMQNLELELCGECGESRFTKRFKLFGKRAGWFFYFIDEPKLWWPYGYGEPNVYNVKVKIIKDGKAVYEQDASFGIRSVELDYRDPTVDDVGQFRFLVNGIEIMCRGSNWVPMDAFHSRDAERYEKALALVKDVGCNILRCWGGNVYEDHAFYDFCDRNGIMVWQDFSMACRSYPETDEFKKKLYSEAVSVIRKLRNHPSVILWAGDNEVDMMARPFIDPNLNTLTREVIARVVRENDVGRPYLPSSPYISSELYRAIKETGARIERCEEHLWGPRDYYKGEYYRTSKSVFVSETGYHGCPSLESIKKFITPERVWHYKDNPEWILHSSDQCGNDARVMLMENQVRVLFGDVPEDPEKYILASQISQAEAKKYFIERIRVGRPKKTGIIWWNLLDGWPQMSDAVVDYYYTKKLAYEYIKRSQAAFCIIADEPCEGYLPIYVCNDTLEEKHGELTVRDAESGEVIYTCGFKAEVNTSTKIVDFAIEDGDRRMLIFEWTCNGERGYNHYLLAKPTISLDWYADMMKKYRL